MCANPERAHLPRHAHVRPYFYLIQAGGHAEKLRSKDTAMHAGDAGLALGQPGLDAGIACN
jgi:hypothetical protein